MIDRLLLSQNMASGDSRVIHLSPAAEADRLIMVVIADPQLGMKGGASDWREDITTFDRVIKAVNILHPRPHFCVVVGDFVHHHPSIYPEMENCASVFERQLNDFQSCVAQLHESIPVFFCPGNHDGMYFLGASENLYGASLQTDSSRICFEYRAATLISRDSCLEAPETDMRTRMAMNNFPSWQFADT